MTTPQETLDRHAAFRRARDHGLADPHGWLSVTALTWVGEDRQQVEGFPGTWWREGDVLHVHLAATEDVALGGVPFSGRHELRLDDGQGDSTMSHGDVVAEVIRRDGRYGVRPRDPQAPLLQAFSAVPVFDHTGDAVIEGVFTAAAPQTVPIATAHDGVAGTATVLGTLRFALDGQAQELAVTGTPEFPNITFHDPTNGDETAAWRFAPLPSVADVSPGATREVRLDLNRSLNYPSGFIPDFGTCPRPVEGNRVTVPVRAGEKDPAG